MVIRPGSNSRPSAWQPDAQATEPPLRWGNFETARNQCYNSIRNSCHRLLKQPSEKVEVPALRYI